MEKNIATKRLVALSHAIDQEHKMLLELSKQIDADLTEKYSVAEKNFHTY
jgi:hypothetical protein